MSFIQDKIDQLKAFIAKFDEQPQVQTPPVAPPVVQVQLIDVDLKNGTKLTVDKLEVGGVATIAGVPATVGDYEAADGSIIKIGEGGIITEIVAAPTDMIPPPDANMQQPQVPVTPVTPAQLQSMVEKFAEGTPEERIAKIETVCRALMEYSFGWELREQQAKAVKDAAIATYKSGFESQKTELETLKADFAKATSFNTELKENFKALFGIVEEMAKLPSGDPAEPVKLSFAQELVKGRSEKMAELAANMKNFKEKQKK